MTNDKFMNKTQSTNAIPAFVRVREYGGTYIATTRIGQGKPMTASCTAGAEFVVKRAALKVLRCAEDAIELKEAGEDNGSLLFWVHQN